MQEPPSRPVLDPVVITEPPRLSTAPACERTHDQLASGAALPSAATDYRLILVRGDAAARPAWVEGRLSLEPRPVELRRVGAWEAPLQGTAEIDLATVGAQRPGSLSSDDPAAPGVLILRLDGPDPTILLRFGSTANRTDVRPIDGAYTVLTVLRVDDGGFAGSWRSGLFGDEVRGYFCAAPVG